MNAEMTSGKTRKHGSAGSSPDKAKATTNTQPAPTFTNPFVNQQPNLVHMTPRKQDQFKSTMQQQVSASA